MCQLRFWPVAKRSDIFFEPGIFSEFIPPLSFSRNLTFNNPFTGPTTTSLEQLSKDYRYSGIGWCVSRDFGQRQREYFPIQYLNWRFSHLIIFLQGLQPLHWNSYPKIIGIAELADVSDKILTSGKETWQDLVVTPLLASKEAVIAWLDKVTKASDASQKATQQDQEGQGK